MIKIAGIDIPLIAGFGINQTLDEMPSETVLRTKNGTGIPMSRWVKFVTTISGEGWMPDGLDGINKAVAQDIYCGVSLSVANASNVITIPRAFRTDGDYAPKGVAIIDQNGFDTPVVMAGSQATLTAVTGATQYHITYFPILTCKIRKINRALADANVRWSWQIEAEEL